MKTLLISFVLCVSFNSYGQQFMFNKPDYAKIQRDVADSVSKFFYPKLMSRYLRNDTTLGIEEYRHLYFGYTFQEAYDPWWSSEEMDTLQRLYTKGTFTEADCRAIIKYARKSIEKFPFDLRQIAMLPFAYHTLGDETEANKWAFKAGSITQVIIRSGNGKSPESAWHVILQSHEYDIIRTIGLERKPQVTPKGNTDYVELEENEYKLKGVYFDVGRIFDAVKKKKR